MPGTPRDYLDTHPSRPVRLVEVAETSLVIDRLRKGRLYARAGVADYWVVNLIDEGLEVYRKPRTLQTGTGRASPFSVTGPTSAASMMLSTAPATRAEIKICPLAASAHSRAARFVTVPIAP